MEVAEKRTIRFFLGIQRSGCYVRRQLGEGIGRLAYSWEEVLL
jgi:hypothetical protein